MTHDDVTELSGGEQASRMDVRTVASWQRESSDVLAQGMGQGAAMAGE